MVLGVEVGTPCLPIAWAEINPGHTSYLAAKDAKCAMVNIPEATTQLAALVERAEAGAEIIIAGANKPVVRLVPVQSEPVQRRLGEANGLVRISPDFDELPDYLMELLP